MKANAPEKIYLFENPITETPYDRWLSKRSDENDIEYTQTDAFIEKTCSWLEENKDKYLYNTGEKGEYIPTCSGKMVEDFRAYMEGE